MRSIVFLVLINVFSPMLFGQKIKLKERKYYQSKINKEVYFVLKKNEYFKHGEYKLFHENGKLSEHGAYQMNKKDGEWKEFNSNGDLQRVSFYENGKITADKKVGIWRKYYENGQVITAYDYDRDKALKTIINVQAYYPALARENELQGTVKVMLKFDGNCDVKELKVITSLSDECDKEAVKGVKKLAEWIKKYDQDRCNQEGEVIPVEFKLE